MRLVFSRAVSVAMSMQPRQGQLTPKARNLAAVVLLASLFLLVNLAILIPAGVRAGGDSPRYLSGAEDLVQGRPLTVAQTFALGYLALIAFCHLIGVGVPGVIVIQLAAAALAATALYDLGRQLYGRSAGIIAAALFVGNPDIARWNAFILTDSLYLSLVILAVWCVHTADTRRHYWYILAAAALITAALIRLSGLFLLLAAVIYLGRNKTGRWLAISTMVVLFVSGAVALSQVYPISSYQQVLRFRHGSTGIIDWRLSMPPDTRRAPTAWADLLGYVSRHPIASVRLVFTRVGIELIHVRPSYSLRHNVSLLATLPLLYLLALMGLTRNRNKPLIQLILLAASVHLVVVAGTFADWDGRYLVHILPLICLLSSCAAASLIDQYLRHRAPHL